MSTDTAHEKASVSARAWLGARWSLGVGERSRAGRASAIAALLVAASLAGAGPACASTRTIVVEIEPTAFNAPTAYFQVLARPGAHKSAGTIELLNRTQRPVAVSLDPVDGATADTLGWLFSDAGEPIHQSARWLRLGSPRVLVPAHGRRIVSVAVAAGNRATPGDYLSGVALESTGTARASEMRQQVVAVESLVPGARHAHVSLTGARIERARSSAVLSLLASNDGNVILKDVHGRVSVSEAGRQVLSAAIGPGTFVAHTSIAFPIEAPRLSLAGGATYQVDAQLTYKHALAMLDTRVRVPRAQPTRVDARRKPAARAQSPQTPAAHARSSGHPHAEIPGIAWVALGALVSVLALLAAAYRRRRVLLPRRATLSMLEHTLSTLDPDECPLSAIHIALNAPSRTVNRRVAALLRHGLRKGDVVGDLWRRGLVVVLADTGRASANELCAKLAGVVREAEAQNLVSAIETETAESAEELRPLLEWLRRKGLGVLARGRVVAQMTPAPAAMAAIPEPAIAVPEPASAVPEPASAVPEPAIAVPEPAIAVPVSAFATPEQSFVVAHPGLAVSEHAPAVATAPWTVPVGELFGAPGDGVRAQYAEGLVQAGLATDASLEFRAALYANDEDGRRKLYEDIAAMGGHGGGVLVLGTLAPAVATSTELNGDR